MTGELDFGLIFTMCLLHLLALISPGPDFLLTLRNALSFGPRIGIATAFGFGAGILIHLTYCIAGIAVVLVRMPWFPYLKFIAAGYLVWMGISSLLSLRHFQNPVSPETSIIAGKKTALKGFFDGLVTNLFNPKAVLFLMGLFTTVVNIDSDRNSVYLAAVLIVIITILWFVLVSTIFGNERIRKIYFKSEKFLTTIFALFFIGIGILFCLN